MMRRFWCLTAVLGIVPAATAWAQEDACTYDACALRVSGRGGSVILRGVESERIARIGFWGFAPRLPLLAERSDSAAYYYRRFRSAHNTSNWLFLVGTVPAAIIGVMAALEPDREAGTLGIGLLVTFTGTLVAGAIVRGPAPDRLSRAIWWYNRTLPPSASPGTFPGSGVGRRGMP